MAADDAENGADGGVAPRCAVAEVYPQGSTLALPCGKRPSEDTGPAYLVHIMTF